MKKSIFTLLVMLLFGSAHAQQWQPDPNSYYQNIPGFTPALYENNATIVAVLYIDDVLATGLNYEIGVYDETTNLYVGGIPAYMYPQVSQEFPLYYITYYGNAGDLLSFRVYDHDLGIETSLVCDSTFIYKADDHHGLPSSPFEFYFYSEGHDYVFNNIVDNSWANVANWTVGGEAATRLPVSLDDVTINGSCTLDMDAIAASVTINGILTISTDDEDEAYTLNSDYITIKDGAQLFTPEDYVITATVEKEIAGYTGDWNNWYLIAKPGYELDEAFDFEAAGMLNGDFDLYFFDQEYPGDPEEDPDNGEWRNYKYYEAKGELENFAAYYGGYLYANSQDVTLSFTGDLNTAAEVEYKKLPCDNSADDGSMGFSLIGNPYACNAAVTYGSKVDGLYMMNEEGRADIIPVENAIIAPATALFVHSTKKDNNASIKFTPEDGTANVRSMDLPRVNIEVRSNGVLQDRAYVRMYESSNLIKFNLRNDGSKLFIPVNGKRYAAAYAGENNVMPVSFTTTENGTYTLSVNPEDMTCSYLHLIDNMTGADVDLLRTSTYTFESNSSDYTSRFKLVFAENALNEIANSFAYINNGNLMINNDGAAKLQVMDATGRILSSENINGCYSKSLNLSAGVYVVRLINGADMKTQKIVVE